MTFSKITKTKKLPQNDPKAEKSKSQKACKEDSNDEIRKQTTVKKFKILRMTFSKISKTTS